MPKKQNKILSFLKSFYQINGKSFFRKDIIAGITVALVIIPQAMAYAGLAGLPFEIGLYTAFIGVIICGLFSANKQISTGPVTIISLMTAASIGSLGVSSIQEYIAYSSLLAFFIGIFYLILKTFKLSIIIEFISHPVVIGFTNGIAIITILSQINKIFSVEINNFFLLFYNFENIFSEIFLNTHFIHYGLGIFGIIFLIFFKQFFPKQPRVLFLIFITIIFSYFIGYENNFNGNVIGNIPKGLPHLNLSFFELFGNIENISKIIGFAIIIGLIGFTETISVVKGVSLKTKQKIETDKELFSQGISNIFSSLFGGYAVAGSFSRTAVNLRAGAKTGLSSVITGIIIGITLMFLTPVLYHLPMSILAAIIIVAVASLIKIKPIFESWKIQRLDCYISIITFLLTLYFSPNVEKAIIIGSIISLGYYIYKSIKTKVVEVSLNKNGNFRDANYFSLNKSKNISIIRIDGSIFFANCGHIENEILHLISEKNKLKIIIFDFEWVNNIDYSGYIMIKNLSEKLKKSGVKIYFSSLRIKVYNKFKESGFLSKIGKNKFYEKPIDILIKFKNKNNNKLDLDFFNIKL